MSLYPSTEKRGPSCCRGAATSLRAFFSAALALLALLTASYGHAAPPQSFVIQNVRATVKQHWLFADLSVSVDDEEGLRNMLKDGAVLALGVAISVERVRSWWSNEEIGAGEYVSTIFHDPLTRDFLVELPDAEGPKQNRDKNLTRLLHLTWRQLSIPVISIERLYIDEPESQYLVKLNFSLQHTEVPPWLENSLMFWSSNVVPKQTVTLEYSLPAQQ